MTNASSQIKKAFFIVLVVLGGAAALWLDYGDDAEVFQAEAPKPTTDLTKMTMAQAITHCRALWTAGHYDQAPLAIAWHPGGLDWYVLDGVDTTSMRHYSCNGNEVTRGARYERVMGRLVPPPPTEPRSILGDRNLFSHYAALPGGGLNPIEATEHPATRALIERRWPKTEGGEPKAQSDWANAKDFPVLFRQPPAGIASEHIPKLASLPPPINWIKEPARVFALLEKEMPRNARIAELNFDDKSIKLQIVGPIKSFEDKEPAPFGDASFDEYGIRDSSWWYPRPQTGTSCTPGHTLSEVADWFAKSSNAASPKLWSASFGCKGAANLVGRGSWTLWVHRR